MENSRGLFRKHEARQPIAVRVLLPVHEMLRRRHRQRVARNARAAMRRRPQPHDLRAKADRPVIGVTGGVMEPDEDRHAVTRYARICPRNTQFPCNFRAAVNRLCAVRCHGELHYARAIAGHAVLGSCCSA